MFNRKLQVERIRASFPAFQGPSSRKPPIYLDNACMTLKPGSVIEEMARYYNEHPSCHGRAVHSFGKATSEKVELARKKIASWIGAKDKKTIVFTKNATESINLVAQALPAGRKACVLTTDLEHNSNMLPWQFLKYREQAEFLQVPIRPEDPEFDLETYRAVFARKKVGLVSCFHRSNVTGIRLPVREMVRIAHQHGALFLLDAAQSVSSEQIDVGDLDVDFLALSVHKMFGPTGVGILYGKAECLNELVPLSVGGEGVLDATYDSCVFAEVPHRFEIGLLNYGGIIGSAAALDFLSSLDLASVNEHVLGLNRRLSDQLAGIEECRLLGPRDPALRGGIVNVSLPHQSADEIGLMLDRAAKVMVRTGVHCAHAWFHKYELAPSLRVSFSIYNTSEEVDKLTSLLIPFLKRG